MTEKDLKGFFLSKTQEIFKEAAEKFDISEEEAMVQFCDFMDESYQ